MMDLISLVLYAPLFCSWDTLDLSLSICLILYGMDLVFQVLYAPLSKG